MATTSELACVYLYASVPKVPEALCFRVVRPSGFFRLRDNSSIT